MMNSFRLALVTKLGTSVLVFLLVASCTSGEGNQRNARMQTLCDWSVETPDTDGRKVRFTALYLTDLTHSSAFHDAACKKAVGVGDAKDADGSYDRLADAVRTDRAALKSYDYRVDVSGTLRIAPPSGLIMDPLRDSPRLMIDVEQVWSFERVACTNRTNC